MDLTPVLVMAVSVTNGENCNGKHHCYPRSVEEDRTRSRNWHRTSPGQLLLSHQCPLVAMIQGVMLLLPWLTEGVDIPVLRG